VVRRRTGGTRPRRRSRARADPLRRHRPLPQGAHSRTCADPRSRRRRPRDGAADARRTRTGGAACLARGAGPRDLRPRDSQRIARAVEVWLGTGIGLAAWHERQGEALRGWRASAILFDPPRENLRQAIADRFDAMLAAGALDEVRAVLAGNPAPSLPGLRAHGVPELLAHLRGEITLEAARDRAVAATIAYVKRQRTWFRHQPIAAPTDTRRITTRIRDPGEVPPDLLDDLASPPVVAS
jgi:tRNA dimethylallyltransferase